MSTIGRWKCGQSLYKDFFGKNILGQNYLFGQKNCFDQKSFLGQSSASASTSTQLEADIALISTSPATHPHPPGIVAKTR